MHSETESQQSIRRGILLIVAGLMIIPSIDAIAKHLSGSVPVLQITWSRFLFQSLLMSLLLVPFHGLGALQSIQPGIHLIRGVLLAIATLIFFASLQYLPLADAIAIFFIQPLILTLFSSWFLGETVGWHRKAAVFTGFLGALIVIQPGGSNFTAATLMPVATAVFFAAYMTLTRATAGKEKAETAQFAAGLGAFLVLSVVIALGMLFDISALKIVQPTIIHWGWLLLLGIIAAGCHLLVVKATELAPASVLAPFAYTEFVGATFLGWLFFDDIPTSTTWAGTALIVASGLYVFVRETRQNSEQMPSPH